MEGGRRVCMSGALGFIGNEEKVKHLLDLPNATTHLSLWKGDLIDKWNFDDAINICSGVFHVATPMYFISVIDPENEVIKTTVNGVLNIMRSCVKAKTVKRLVYTSTTGTIVVQRQPPTRIYFVAKTTAEKAPWKFAEENGSDLVTIQPSIVFGPFITPSRPLSFDISIALITRGVVLQILTMEGELVEMWRSLDLTTEENQTIKVDLNTSPAQPNGKGFFLVGKLLTRKHYNREAFKTLITKVWKPMKGLHISDFGDDMFVFKFGNELEARRVLLNGPWNFDCSLLLLERATGYEVPSAVNLQWASFWVRCYNLPILCMNKDMGKKLGACIGDVEDVDVGLHGDCLGKFLRIRVRVDVLKPLLRGVKMEVPTSPEPTWIPFKYEKLGDFCYGCGRLGHGVRECWYQSLSSCANDNGLQYDEWLRVTYNGPRFKKIDGTEGRSFFGRITESDDTASESDQVRSKVRSKKVTSSIKHVTGAAEHTASSMQARSDGDRAAAHGAVVETMGISGAGVLVEVPIALVGSHERRANESHNEEKNRIISPKSVGTMGEGVKKPTRKFKRLVKCGKVHDEGSFTWVGLVDDENIDLCGSELSKYRKAALKQGSDDTFIDGSGKRAHIDAMISVDSTQPWRFIGFYGCPETENHHHSWALLRRLHSLCDAPWVVMGDFNEIMVDSEKEWGRVRGARLMSDFRMVSLDCDLMDIKVVGPRFTWYRSFPNGQIVKERLDRALGNFRFQTLFPNANLSVLGFHGSDHRAILLDLECGDCGSATTNARRGNGFKFEEYWVRHEDCRNTVLQAWAAAGDVSSMDQCTSNIFKCGRALMRWSRATFGDLRRTIEKKENELDQAIIGTEISQDAGRVMELQREINDLKDAEECYWKQRSRAEWLSWGDRNTKFFYQRASCRRARNAIKGLVDQSGEWRTGAEDIGRIIQDYFAGIFTSTHPTGDQISAITSLIHARVTEDMNRALCNNGIPVPSGTVK
ncbi:hypothetical protein LguiB_017186 [Lonicera macranthoides]